MGFPQPRNEPRTWTTSAAVSPRLRSLKRRPPMPENASFDYAILRVVPRVERQEFINAGVVLFCRERRYLDARIHLDEGRLRALWPAVDVELVRQHLEAVPLICAGDALGG